MFLLLHISKYFFTPKCLVYYAFFDITRTLFFIQKFTKNLTDLLKQIFFVYLHSKYLNFVTKGK